MLLSWALSSRLVARAAFKSSFVSASCVVEVHEGHMMFPVITGATGDDRAPRAFDCRIQLVEYKPRVLEHPPIGPPA